MTDLSIIVPVFGQWHLVPSLLDRLGEQSLPSGRVEVILVDNASPDFSAPPRIGPNVRIVRCEIPGSYAARNLGATLARSDRLVFTDADCLPRREWAETLWRQDDRGLFAGRVIVGSTSQRPNACEVYEIVKGIPQERYVKSGYAATANLMVPKKAFDELGGFDAGRFSGGDAAFCRKASAAGYPVRYVHEAVVEHPARSSWAELATKARRIKGGQLVGDTPWRYGVWRTVLPPVIAWWRFLSNNQHPLSYRVIACMMQFRLWGVEIEEVFRLRAGGIRERR